MNYIAKYATLPFAKGKTECDLLVMGDGNCDNHNNDMTCDFDGGDCCEETCDLRGSLTPSPTAVDGDDGELCVAFNCKDPNIAKTWPFYTSNDDTTYPFITQQAFMNVLKAKNLTAGFEDLPSLSCPDCATFNASYMSIPFKVEAEEYLQISKNESLHLNEMFPTLNSSRIRTFLKKNRVVGGVLVTQQRTTSSSCTSLPSRLEKLFSKVCNHDDAENRAPFGVDPTFVSTSSLYRSTNERIKMQHYSTEELKVESSLPFGFFYDMGCTDCHYSHYSVKDFPILFDTNFNVSRVQTYLDMILEGNYVDDYTASIDISLPLINADIGRFVLIQVTFSPVDVGNWNMDYDINVIPVSVNNWRNFHHNPADAWECHVEIVYFLFFFVLWYVEYKEMRHTVKETGYLFAYIFDVFNLLDWLNYIFQFLFILYWFLYMREIDELAEQIELHYEAYYDYKAVARLTQVTHNMGKYQALLDKMESVVDLRASYAQFLAYSLLTTVCQTLKNLDFHPKLGTRHLFAFSPLKHHDFLTFSTPHRLYHLNITGIVTKTISYAAADLLFFFLLLFIMIIICTCVVCIFICVRVSVD